MLQKNYFLISTFFGQRTTKIDKKLRKFTNPNRLMKFSEIWYVHASQQKKMLQKTDFRFRHFLAKKQQKLTKNEENCQNPNRLIKFSEI